MYVEVKDKMTVISSGEARDTEVRRASYIPSYESVVEGIVEDFEDFGFESIDEAVEYVDSVVPEMIAEEAEFPEGEFWVVEEAVEEAEEEARYYARELLEERVG